MPLSVKLRSQAMFSLPMISLKPCMITHMPIPLSTRLFGDQENAPQPHMKLSCCDPKGVAVMVVQDPDQYEHVKIGRWRQRQKSFAYSIRKGESSFTRILVADPKAAVKREAYQLSDPAGSSPYLAKVLSPICPKISIRKFIRISFRRSSRSRNCAIMTLSRHF